MQLTDHFSLAELTASQMAARQGREIIPTPEQLANLKRLCVTLLEPIRIQLAHAILISSGLRPDWLNQMIGGAPGSAHLDGRAADITAVGMTAVGLARWIRNSRFQPDKCIVEFNRWVHIQIAKDGAKPRNEWLTASVVNGVTVYGVFV